MESHEVSPEQQDLLLRAYEDLRSLADHPAPVVRGGARQATADVAQILNALGLRYELYSNELEAS